MEILKEIKKASINNKKSFAEIGLKISEESGECSQALLSFLGANGSEYKELDSKNVKEESVDIILAALSLFYKLEGNDEELIKTLTFKFNKWKDKAGL